jgi:hypothetical protein
MRQSISRHRCDDAGLGIHATNAIVFKLGDKQIPLTVHGECRRPDPRFGCEAAVSTEASLPIPRDCRKYASRSLDAADPRVHGE